MEVLDVYRSILQCAGFTVGEDDMVSVTSKDQSKPFMVDGKRLVIPSARQTNVPDWKNRVAFHPLQENTASGESKVLKALRGAFNIRLNHTTMQVMNKLLAMAIEVEATHHKLSPDQQQYLSLVKDVDQTAFENLQSILGQMKITQVEKQFVRIFIRKGGLYQGKPYSRVGVVSFPLYEELKKESEKKGKHTIYGVGVRAKDLKIYMALLSYIFPKIDEPEAYNFGSNSKLVPSIHALMQAMMYVASDLNTVLDIFENQIEDPEELRFAAEWVDAFMDADALASRARMIPMLPGNEGSADKVEEANKASQLNQNARPTSPTAHNAPGTDRPVVQPQQQPYHQVEIQHQPEVPTEVAPGKAAFKSRTPHHYQRNFGGSYGGYQPPQEQPGAQTRHNRAPSWGRSDNYGQYGQGGGYGNRGYGGGYGGGRGRI